MDPLRNSSDTTANSEQNAAPHNSRPQRDEKGRFGKGNRGGPGNPFTRQTARLRQAALDAVSAEDIHDVMQSLKQKAKEGDVAAIKLLLSYSVGKPTTSANPDTLDQNELQTLLDTHVATPKSMIEIVQGMPMEVVLLMLRAMLPALFASKLQQAAAILSQSAGTADEDGEDEAEEDAAEDEEETIAPAHVADEAQDARPDSIPDWLHQVINPSPQQKEVATQAKPRRARKSVPHRGKTTKQLDDIQKQLQDLMDEVKKPRATGNEKHTNGTQGLHEELLRILLGRMSGPLDRQEAEAPPIANGRIGGQAER